MGASASKRGVWPCVLRGWPKENLGLCNSESGMGGYVHPSHRLTVGTDCTGKVLPAVISFPRRFTFCHPAF